MVEPITEIKKFVNWCISQNAEVPPTLLYVQDEKLVVSFVGALSKDNLITYIKGLASNLPEVDQFILIIEAYTTTSDLYNGTPLSQMADEDRKEVILLNIYQRGKTTQFMQATIKIYDGKRSLEDWSTYEGFSGRMVFNI